ncbi:hypothetical protein WAF85_004265 [Salmonella enterica]|uniref:Uncharacterized protein n=2 Tax=Salmonella enterica TaxID=28901 RepID=A0A5V0Q2T8_SALER|nr:hypothetical protein [Salmonella enterica]ECO1003820.1 hypothetical protein [Salmonella enterica subsp. enterica serovar Give]EDI3196973.1 hypothetical protein [Salmonella enterica subsp. enterica serovar Rubislaw]EDR1011391.1 hypothetical protein [Salmonella enterica subsp. enterica serovar Glostrup]EEE1621067.1 hypothetical protein [Salmonella enterica subsp. enterica serovar Oranienburg]EFC2566590.1 hypothetical protein [Escherichia coli]ELJ2724544.1 hypothetical protein [Salmonella ent
MINKEGITVKESIDRLCPQRVVKYLAQKGSADALQTGMMYLYLVVSAVGEDRLCLMNENHRFSIE